MLRTEQLYHSSTESPPVVSHLLPNANPSYSGSSQDLLSKKLLKWMLFIIASHSRGNSMRGGFFVCLLTDVSAAARIMPGGTKLPGNYLLRK